MNAHAVPDAYAALPLGDCAYCADPVTVQDAEPLLLANDTIAHYTCYQADYDAWARELHTHPITIARNRHAEDF